MTKQVEVVIIGVGGIGSRMADDAAKLLAFPSPKMREHWGDEFAPRLTLVDGDAYEERNLERQSFTRIGNKAESKRTDLKKLYPGLDILAMQEFLCPENAPFILTEDATVLICVDNHATRKLISEYIRDGNVQDITVINGGNDTAGHGDAHFYVVRGGKDLTPSLLQVDPAIAEPKEKPVWEMSCEERAQAGEPQLFVANVFAATAMLGMLYGFLSNPDDCIDKAVGNQKNEYVDPGVTWTTFDIEFVAMRSERETCHPVVAEQSDPQEGVKQQEEAA
ncbi:MAG: ThiF family adenylyltransferase [Candidatus Uhrbacteria bacterium]